MKEDPKQWQSAKLAIGPDHPRRRIKIKLCMVSGLRCVHVKCDSNRLRAGWKMALPALDTLVATVMSISFQISLQ